MTITRTSSVPTRRRNVLRWVGRVAATAGGLALCVALCALPILLFGGGLAAFTDALVNDGKLMLPIGLVLVGLGTAYLLARRRSDPARGRSAQPWNDGGKHESVR